MAAPPYSPTLLLASPKHADTVYVLDSPSPANVRLRGLNISDPLAAENLSLQDITPDVPFGGNAGTAYTAFVGQNGTIYSLAGKCSDGAKGATAWTFTPDGSSMSGEWAQGIVTVQETGNTTVGGANFLAGGVAFSSNLNASADMYVFGGMCPDASSSQQSWQSEATYSNSLLHLQPEQAQGMSDYDLQTVGSRGPPIPEAGFTITPLSPTYFNTTAGNVTIQQNFVLLGGHTQTAFINMSQVAVLSLPEQTWSFLPINEPTGSTGADNIDPRSGHSAVLSEDGQQIVLLGGWVGDVNTPADPQLAILEIGEGYGGNGNWQWDVMTAQGSGPAANGIYGHGAIMLPGNVLMVSGGFEIGSGQGELARRAAPDAYFLNVTSKEWISSYQNPGHGSTQHASSGSDATKVGLGAGLGVGLAVLIAVIVAFFWCRRKKRRERTIHENDLRALALGNDQLHSPILGFGGIDGRGGEFGSSRWSHHPGEEGANAYSWAPPLRDSAVPGQTRPQEAERTGLLVEIPSPTRGLRRSLHSRGNHWFEDGRRSRGSSYIHPIDERDEYEAVHQDDLAEMIQLNNTSAIPRPPSRRLSDPFRDPPEQRSLLDGSRSPSPQMLVHTVTPAVAVATTAAAAEAGHREASRDEELNPTDTMEAAHLAVDKADRTSSSLSNRSMVSALSQQPPSSNGDSIGRTQSQRSAALFSTHPLAPSTNPTTISDATDDWSPRGGHRMSAPPVFGTPSQIKRRPVPVPLGSHPTVRKSIALQPGSSPSSFTQLQAEGPNLLRGSPHGPGFPMPGHVAAAVAAFDSDNDNDFDAEPLSRRKASHTRPKSWMGSVRRALVGSTGAASQSSRSSATPSPVGRSGGISPRRSEFHRGGIEGLAGDVAITSPEPAAARPGQLQRSTSMDQTGSPWVRRQQGARAWEDDSQRSNTFTSDTGPIGDWGAPALQSGSASIPAPSISTGESESEEWDVESAVERRVVQLMFTVPKEKLRVVNRGVDEADSVSVKSGRSGKLAGPSTEHPRMSREIVPLDDEHAIPDREAAETIMDDEAPIRVPRARDMPRAEIRVPATMAVDDDENFVVHGITDDEKEDEDEDRTEASFQPRSTTQPQYAPLDSDDEDANFVIHAQTDDEDEPEPELPAALSDDEDRENTPVPRALAWRKQRDAAIERLRQTSGEAAVERVRAGSGESTSSARAGS